MTNSRGRVLEDIRRQKRLATTCLVAGILAIVVGVFVFAHSRRFYLSGVRAPGKIVELEVKQFDKDFTFYPVFSFVDQAGTTNVIHSKVGYTSNRWGIPRQYAVGDTVEVMYPADDSGSAKINDWWSVWSWTIVFGGGGLVLTVAGIVLWRGAVTWPREGAGSQPRINADRHG